MSVMTLGLTDDQHQRLKSMAGTKGLSLNNLLEQLSAQALTENDLELRYRRLAAVGSAKRGLELLDKLDEADRG
jgi:hypothetical protein